MSDQEMNFASAILDGRNFRDIPDDEVLERARELLSGWMEGELRMERPKLYDHYALLLLALIRRTQTLEARLQALEAGAGGPGSSQL